MMVCLVHCQHKGKKNYQKLVKVAEGEVKETL